MTLISTDPRGIYWGDYAMWSLTPHQRHALRFGWITPMEARQLRDLAIFTSPPIKEMLRLMGQQKR